MATAKPVRSKATSSTQANENQLQGRIFASYVPPASFMDSNIQGMAVSEKYSSRFPETNMFEGMRIVIEPNPKKPGDYIFTTIPMAELGPGIEDEGEWPRFVSFIGTTTLMPYQQWARYKCNPLYQCTITKDERIPTICMREPDASEETHPSAAASTSTATPLPRTARKRRLSEVSSEAEVMADLTAPDVTESIAKRPRVEIIIDDDETEQAPKYNYFQDRNTRDRLKKQRESKQPVSSASKAGFSDLGVEEISTQNATPLPAHAPPVPPPAPKKPKIAIEVDRVQVKRRRSDDEDGYHSVDSNSSMYPNPGKPLRGGKKRRKLTSTERTPEKRPVASNARRGSKKEKTYWTGVKYDGSSKPQYVVVEDTDSDEYVIEIPIPVKTTSPIEASSSQLPDPPATILSSFLRTRHNGTPPYPPTKPSSLRSQADRERVESTTVDIRDDLSEQAKQARFIFVRGSTASPVGRGSMTPVEPVDEAESERRQRLRESLEKMQALEKEAKELEAKREAEKAAAAKEEDEETAAFAAAFEKAAKLRAEKEKKKERERVKQAEEAAAKKLKEEKEADEAFKAAFNAAWDEALKRSDEKAKEKEKEQQEARAQQQRQQEAQAQQQRQGAFAQQQREQGAYAQQQRAGPQYHNQGQPSTSQQPPHPAQQPQTHWHQPQPTYAQGFTQPLPTFVRLNGSNVFYSRTHPYPAYNSHPNPPPVFTSVPPNMQFPPFFQSVPQAQYSQAPPGNARPNPPPGYARPNPPPGNAKPNPNPQASGSNNSSHGHRFNNGPPRQPIERREMAIINGKMIPLLSPAKAYHRYADACRDWDAFLASNQGVLPPAEMIPYPVSYDAEFPPEYVTEKQLQDFYSRIGRYLEGEGKGLDTLVNVVKEATRRFHPDRWRSRGFVVIDPSTATKPCYPTNISDCLTRISQVVNPLYAKLTTPTTA